MGIDIKLDRRHDLALSKTNDLVLIDGAQRVRQQIEVTLLTFLGEWFLDVSWGIPYLEKIMIKTPNRAEIENIIRAKVRDVPGVTAVPSVQVELDARARQGRITLPDIQTTEGLISVSVTR
ncbi:hypothetical protein [Paracandidimonas lactea]|uniref:hypothetical protein n=1 Tax=Paracandidimonas lactea TaxID=2895524 RepID=UPI001F48494E|nr:hypothetical protein [Paracandidimonas lactea]